MGYFMVHLKVAQKLLKSNITINDVAAFYKGSLAPDAIMFRQGAQRSDKSFTHFCVGGEGWGYYTNYEEWENSLKENIQKFKDINVDFIFGYYAHILTDIAYSTRIWTPIRLTQDKQLIEDYIKDCNEIDSRFLKSLDNKEQVWSYLKQPPNYYMPSVINADEITKLIDDMIFRMYYNRKSNFLHKFKAITPTDMLDFVDETAVIINKAYR